MTQNLNFAFTIFLITISMLLIFLNAFFVAAEFSIVKIRRTRLEELAMSGNIKARNAIICIDHLDEYLSATQLGITLVSLALGWIGEESFYHLFLFFFSGFSSEHDVIIRAVCFTLAFILITAFHVILGELIPKSMAIQKVEKITLIISTPLIFFYKATKPLIVTLTSSANLLLRFMGYTGFKETSWSEEELKLVMEKSKTDGVISENEAMIIQKVFSFSDKMVSQIMVPPQTVEYISLNKSFEENKKTILSNHHTRFPVCSKDLNSVIGIFTTKELGFNDIHENDFFVSRMRKPLIVRPEMKQDHLMKLLTAKRTHMAIVQCPIQKTTLGIVTLEDILEEIVGEIIDEYDN